MEGGKPVGTGDTYERRGSYVISSIGSIPEAIPGIDMKGELFAFTDWDLGRLASHPNVFSAGNVVTGKGNIVASRKHASHVADKVIESFLGVGDAGHAGEEAILDGAREAARRTADGVAEHVAAQSPHDGPALQRLRERVAARQQAVGISDYRSWIERVTPRDLE
jgi:ferredoxin/flavodoxin---NADP+ reductase